jgi:hypothetical protein
LASSNLIAVSSGVVRLRFFVTAFEIEDFPRLSGRRDPKAELFYDAAHLGELLRIEGKRACRARSVEVTGRRLT